MAWPLLTFSPDWNCTSLMVPAISTLRSMPCDALSVPIAGRRLCQSMRRATSASTLIAGLGAWNC